MKSKESGYGAFLLLDYLCSRSRHGSLDRFIFSPKPYLKSWEPEIWLENCKCLPGTHCCSTVLPKWSFPTIFTCILLVCRAAPQCRVGVVWWLGVVFSPRQLVLRWGTNLFYMPSGLGEITVLVEAVREIEGIWLRSIFIAWLLVFLKPPRSLDSYFQSKTLFEIPRTRNLIRKL